MVHSHEEKKKESSHGQNPIFTPCASKNRNTGKIRKMRWRILFIGKDRGLQMLDLDGMGLTLKGELQGTCTVGGSADLGVCLFPTGCRSGDCNRR